MTPQEQSLRDDIQRRLDYFSPKIKLSDKGDGLNVSLRNNDFTLAFLSNPSTGDRQLSS